MHTAVRGKARGGGATLLRLGVRRACHSESGLTHALLVLRGAKAMNGLAVQFDADEFDVELSDALGEPGISGEVAFQIRIAYGDDFPEDLPSRFLQEQHLEAVPGQLVCLPDLGRALMGEDFADDGRVLRLEVGPDAAIGSGEQNGWI